MSAIATAVGKIKEVFSSESSAAEKRRLQLEKWREQSAPGKLEKARADQRRIEAELNAMLIADVMPSAGALARKRGEMRIAAQEEWAAMYAAQQLAFARPISREERKLAVKLLAFGELQSYIRSKLSDASIGGLRYRQTTLQNNLEASRNNEKRLENSRKRGEVAEVQAEIDKFSETELIPWQDVLADLGTDIDQVKSQLAQLQAESAA